MTEPVQNLDVPRFTAPTRCAEIDPDLWFPLKGQSAQPAKRVCRSCEAQPECLEYALTRDIRDGVWGGLSDRERQRLKRGTPRSGRGRLPQPIKHGTEGGSAAHLRRGEKPCESCREARLRADQRRREQRAA